MSNPRETDRIQDLVFLVSSERGRAFLWKVLGDCNVFGASFVPDPLVTAFNEGRRNIGHRLLEEVLTLDPRAFTMMREENAARQEVYKAADEQQASRDAAEKESEDV